ncbi:MAG TPA: hypothetical protein VFQ71_14000 [Gaiellales bacterium]|jgi:hypothetical protein|nr:hypothetical protein [Gaiellales bacterium]
MKRWHGFPLGAALIIAAVVLAARVATGTSGSIARIAAAIIILVGALALFRAFAEA